MAGFTQLAAACGVLTVLCAAPATPARAQAAASAGGRSVTLIRKVSLLGAGRNVEVEILASEPVTPQIKLVSAPFRLVIDLPNSQPSSALRHLDLHRGEVSQVRVGLFAAVPPVTRVVLDLTAAEAYQVFPSGKTVIVKLGGVETGGPGPGGAATPASGGSVPGLISESDMPATLPIQSRPRVAVLFNQGQLSIHVDKGTLAEVLAEVHRLTGADIQIPPGAQQEQIVADIGPAPARDAMASLLNGSHFNFIMVGSDGDPNALHSILLTSKQEGASMPSGSPVQEYSSANQPEPEPPQSGAAMPHTEDPPEETPPPPAPEPSDTPVSP